MSSQEKGKSPMAEEGEKADIRPYIVAVALITRLHESLGPKFEEFRSHFCDFMHMRQTFYDKASLLLKEFPDMLPDTREALDSIVCGDQNFRKSLIEDLTRICSSDQSAITVADNKLKEPKTSSDAVATQDNVSSGNEHLNQEGQEINLLDTVEYCMRMCAQQPVPRYERLVEREEKKPSTRLCLFTHSDTPTVLAPENVLRGNEHPSREIVAQELPRREPMPTSSVPAPRRVSKGNVLLSQEVQERALAQQDAQQQLQSEYWQLIEQYAKNASQDQESPRGRENQLLQELHMQKYQNQRQQQLGHGHLSQEILKQVLARQAANTSSVPVAMQQNVSRGSEHLSQEVRKQELLKGREYSQQQQKSGNAPQKPCARPQRHEKQRRNVPPKPYARAPQIDSKEGHAQQQQQHGHMLHQSYVQQQQLYGQQWKMQAEQESDMQYRHRVAQMTYEQQQQESYRQYRLLQQRYAQPQANTPQQSYVQPQSLQPPQQTGQQKGEEQNADENTSPRTKKD